MARIVYKKGFENQNKLECIEGIEIEMLNGQYALIYPKYAELPLLDYDQINKWKEDDLTEIEALKKEDGMRVTDELLALDSPAAKFVRQFKSDIYGHSNLPALLEVVEIVRQREDINTLAKTIESADLLKEDAKVSSCSRCYYTNGWVVTGNAGYILYYGLSYPYTCVPTIVYRKKDE